MTADKGLFWQIKQILDKDRKDSIHGGTMKDKKRKKEREPGEIRTGRVLVWTAAIVLTAAAIAILLYLIPKDDKEADSLIDGTEPFVFETEPFTEAETEDGVVPRPDID